jgi:glyceraldehyde 3-phosphate dehydrogenase
MSVNVGINGMGRIGRAILKLLVEQPSMNVVAVNDLMDPDNLDYLLRFDSVYGR